MIAHGERFVSPLTFQFRLQSRYGDKPINFQVVCPQNGTAVPKGLIPLPAFAIPDTDDVLAARDKQVEGLSGVTVVAVACGAFHSLAVTSSGRLYEWGLIHTEPDVVAEQVGHLRRVRVDGI